jgi:hypothetical protein
VSKRFFREIFPDIFSGVISYMTKKTDSISPILTKASASMLRMPASAALPQPFYPERPKTPITPKPQNEIAFE